MQDVSDTLTSDQLLWLIQDAPAIETDFGLELISQDLVVLEDISEYCGGGSVSRGSYNDLHGTCSLTISRDLDWGAAIVRPYFTITADAVTGRFNLGAYYTARPEYSTGQNPPQYAVTGYDILSRLSGKTGSSFSLPAGTAVLAAVEQIFTDQGYTRYVIDQTASAKTLTSPYNSPLDDDKTWLTIVNELLSAVGYAGVWSDWDGRLRCHPYISPAQRPIEWTYNVDPDESILSPERLYTQDLYSAPNRWVFVRNSDTDDVTPVEGAGIYTFVNQSEGPTSVDARGGWIITRVERVDAADQAALEARAQVTIDADRRISTTIRTKTSPNPLHWHFDKIALNDSNAGVSWADVLATSWTLPLDGGDMDHEWTVL